ncbi:EVE domain-containing protein [Plasmodiophora brassicae]|uniref:EVE domain-containing protein n=1 Tax=Plasmodiophora brassicae TaxID=37360 RepID=A0A0G4IQ30_PLABS|nr:hypothetical protein PBRA_000599 [Plasmodiophora brassicae]SPQ97561.1 unnamed protein product [Plasmodiophora brassicae]
MPRCFIGFLPRSDVERCVAGGFAMYHRIVSLRRIVKGSWLMYYSSRVGPVGTDWVRSFTAVGKVTSPTPYEIENVAELDAVKGRPAKFRINVNYVDCRPIPARSIVRDIGFVPESERAHLSEYLRPPRYGFLEITRDDFASIARHMQADLKQAIPPPSIDPASEFQ